MGNVFTSWNQSLCLFGIHVDPLKILSGFRKLLNQFLCHFYPTAGAE